VVVGADELVGLTRGLLLAGAHGVMVSLWDVNDFSTTRFMKHFYGQLRYTAEAAAALQAAMRHVREEHPHPYYWAPFVLSGKYWSDMPPAQDAPALPPLEPRSGTCPEAAIL
jgi:CHAT domain-containing protein